MFSNFFGNRKKNPLTSKQQTRSQISTANGQKQKQRRQSIINEFGKCLINLQVDNGEVITIYIIDFMEVPITHETEYFQTIKTTIDRFFELHKENLTDKLYRDSFNLQETEILIIVKDQRNKIVLAFTNDRQNIALLIDAMNLGGITPENHTVLLVRYCKPINQEEPKISQSANLRVPLESKKIVNEIIDYCKLNYSQDNLTFEKWQKLILGLHKMGLLINLPYNKEGSAFKNILTKDYGSIGYNRVQVKKTFREDVRKLPMILPLFVVILAFFCSERYQDNSFFYHYLFESIDSRDNRFTGFDENIFTKLFNQLLEQSLPEEQFKQCLLTIYYQAFMPHENEINKLFSSYRKQHLQEKEYFKFRSK